VFLQSDRLYHPAWSMEKAQEYIKEQSGIFFDPEIVEPFLVMISGVKR
jgi:response regulator RpfG family c-di-GMP phosphodiesterase